MKSRERVADRHAIEARLGARLAGSLTLRAQAVPQDVAVRLRFARERALERARESRRAAATARGVGVVGLAGSGAALLAGAGAPWWQRAASVFPLLLLVLGLMTIDHWSVRERVLAAAEIDAQLLADKLPPVAYSDPGFAEYLRTAPAQ